MVKLIVLVESELPEVELLVHVGVRNYAIHQVEQDEVWYVYEQQQFEDGIALLQNSRLFLFEPEN